MVAPATAFFRLVAIPTSLAGFLPTVTFGWGLVDYLDVGCIGFGILMAAGLAVGSLVGFVSMAIIPYFVRVPLELEGSHSFVRLRLDQK